MKTSSRGIDLIKRYESFSPTQYLCPAGLPTIGYGHVIRHGERLLGPISIVQGDALLAQDLEERERDVLSLVKVPISQNQFDALVSFVFNVGADIDADTIAEGLGDSTLLKKLNAGDYQGAAEEFPKWNKSRGKVLGGLIKRRAEERQMFLEEMP